MSCVFLYERCLKYYDRGAKTVVKPIGMLEKVFLKVEKKHHRNNDIRTILHSLFY